MARKARTKQEYIARVRAVCQARGHHVTTTAVAEVTRVHRNTAGDILSKWDTDGRPLEAYLAALSEGIVEDDQTLRVRAAARERQQQCRARRHAARAGASVDVAAAAARQGAGQAVTGADEDRGNMTMRTVIRPRIAWWMESPAELMTGGKHTAWTLDAIMSRFPGRYVDDFDADALLSSGTTWRQIMLECLQSWGWHVDDAGEWTPSTE